jgi:L-seryl-tRNA(Ser) seleniumtransferase
MTESVYERFGARPIINGMGIYTKLGGAIVSPTVWAAMTEANNWAVEMRDLLDASGEHLAKFLGAEAARVVPGVAAGLALSTAACITRQDPPSVERLPDTTGLEAGVVFQPVQTYRYLRAAWLSGAHPVWAGDESGTTAEQLDEALQRDDVVAALYPAHLDGKPGAVSLHDFSRLAHERGVPVIIDAAFMSYPPKSTSRYVDLGDLVCFSAKYFYGPNGGGFVYGRRDLVEALADADFTTFETGEWRTFGRSFKLDRYTVVGTIAALEEWFQMDHEERWAGYRRAVRVMEDAVRGIRGLEARARFFTPDEALADEPVNCLWLRPDPAVTGMSAADLHLALYEGNPRIVAQKDDEAVYIVVEAMSPGQEQPVGERLRAIFSA